MSSVNRVMLVGRLGKEPERHGGVVVMSVATSEGRKEGRKEEVTEWHRVVVFGKTAENCEKYLGKGSMVYVEGRLETHVWEKDGERRYEVRVLAHGVKFLGSKKGSLRPELVSGQVGAFEEEDVPF